MAFRTSEDFGYIYPENSGAAQLWASILRNSRTTTTLIEVDGDSKLTLPSGAGSFAVEYINALSFFRQRRGGCGATSWCKAITYPATNDPRGYWLVEGIVNGGTLASMGVDIPPNWAVYDCDSTYGAAWRLTPNGQANERTSCTTTGRWWDTSKQFYWDIIVGNRNSTPSPIMYWEHRTSTVDIPANIATDGTVRDKGNIDVSDMNDTKEQRWRVVTLGPFTFHSDSYSIIVVRSPTSGKTVRIGGARARMVNDPGGIVWQTRSTGGASFDTIGTTYNRMGPLTRLGAPAGNLLAYSVNDIGAGTSASAFKTKARQFVQDVRYRYSLNAEQPIAWCNTWPDSDTSAGNQTVYGQYSGAWADICDENPSTCLLINTQKMLRDWGATPATQDVTGITDKGAYAIDTLYSINDSFDYGGSYGVPNMSYKVRTAFTSAHDGLDYPGSSAGQSLDTVPVHWLHVLRSDVSHAGQFGSLVFAALFMEALNHIERTAIP